MYVYVVSESQHDYIIIKIHHKELYIHKQKQQQILINSWCDENFYPRIIKCKQCDYYNFYFLIENKNESTFDWMEKNQITVVAWFFFFFFLSLFIITILQQLQNIAKFIVIVSKYHWFNTFFNTRWHAYCRIFFFHSSFIYIRKCCYYIVFIVLFLLNFNFFLLFIIFEKKFFFDIRSDDDDYHVNQMISDL